jgi:ATP-dependent DNA helicase RecG
MRARELLERLNLADEDTRLEAKRGREVGRSVLETVCSFSNEPALGGGTILIGVERTDDLWAAFTATGVPNPDKFQADFATQCASEFNIPIRPRIEIDNIGDKTLLMVDVLEVAAGEKPIYFKRQGLPGGAYRRIGSTDQRCTEDDLIVFYENRGIETYDATIIPDAALDDLDPAAIAEYRRLRREADANAEELQWPDEQLLRGLCATRPADDAVKPTAAGILLFGTAPAIRRIFPLMRIDYIRVPGKEWIDDPERRFETIEIRAPLPMAIRRAYAAVRDDLPTAFSLPEGSLERQDQAVIPERVLREALVNAVMHRSYRISGSIQIIRYSNRLEIRNPGHSLVADEHLGEPGSQTRNPKIAAVLHDLRLAETKGSGIRVMREMMRRFNLSSPTFESSRSPDRFVATLLFHHFLGEEDLQWLTRFEPLHLTDDEKRALIYVREVGGIDNASYRDLNQVDTLAASGHLRKLRDAGILRMEGRGAATYYVPTPTFKQTLKAGASEGVPSKSEGVGAASEGVPGENEGVPGENEGVASQSEGVFGIPRDLKAQLPRKRERVSREKLRDFILELCRLRAMPARELARLLHRNPVHLVTQHLTPLIKSSQLRYLHPEVPAHPEQAYRTVEIDRVREEAN